MTKPCIMFYAKGLRTVKKENKRKKTKLTFIHVTETFLLAEGMHETERLSPTCLVISPLGVSDKSKSETREKKWIKKIKYIFQKKNSKFALI